MSAYPTTTYAGIRRLVGFVSPFRRLIIVFLHGGLVAAGYWLAFILRFEVPVGQDDWQQFLYTLPLILALRLLTFAWFHMYEEVWRYVSMRDILTILKAVTLSSVVFALAVLGLINPDFPWPIFPIDWGVCLLFVGGGRLAIRAFRESAMNGHPWWEAARHRGKMGSLKDCGKITELLPFGRRQEGCTYAPVSESGSTPVRPLADEKHRRIIVDGRIAQVGAYLP